MVIVKSNGAKCPPGNLIKSVEAALYRVPLAEALSDAGHGVHTHFEIVTCRIICEDGMEGTGYTYTGGRGGTAIRALLADEIRPLLLGTDASAIEQRWHDQRRALHYLGLGGVTGFAIAASDIALWDIAGRRLGKPLWQMVGGHGDSVSCYRGLIDLAYDDDYLLEVVEREMRSGHRGIKLKVGRKDIARDTSRVRSVRDLIGADANLMVDANYSWDAESAITFARSVEEFNPFWFEEPVAHDDLDAYARVAAATAVPLASGENWRTLGEFECAIRDAGVQFLQPDASNVSGITGWLEVARLAQSKGLPIASHGMHELHVSLMSAQPNAAMLEVHSFPIDAYTTAPLKVVEGKATAPATAGIGVSFDQDLIGAHRAA